MKSFCVLNSPLNAAAGESMGKAANAVLGRKIGILCEKKSGSAGYLAKGVKKGGGCAVVFNSCFESQLFFASRHYAFDGLFFVSGGKNCLVCVYGPDGSIISSLQEDEMAKLALSGDLPEEKGGNIIEASLCDAYYKNLLDFSQSFENIRVNIRSAAPDTAAPLKRALLALGGGIGGKICFSLSKSGLVLSAVDENGKVYSHSQLLDACTACEIENGNAQHTTFFAASYLDELAKSKDVKLVRSFAGGNAIWQKDATFLAARLMHYLSLYGCGLAAICEKLPQQSVSRKSFSSELNLSDIADIIECEEVITDCKSGVFARAEQGSLLVTPCSHAGKYCLEVQAANSETANELAALVTNAACLT